MSLAGYLSALATAALLLLPQYSCVIDSSYVSLLENVPLEAAHSTARLAFAVLLDWTHWSEWNSVWVSNVNINRFPEIGDVVSVKMNAGVQFQTMFQVTEVDWLALRFCWQVFYPQFKILHFPFLKTNRCTQIVYELEKRHIAMRTTDHIIGVLAIPTCHTFHVEGTAAYQRLANDLRARLMTH